MGGVSIHGYSSKSTLESTNSGQTAAAALHTTNYKLGFGLRAGDLGLRGASYETYSLYTWFKFRISGLGVYLADL